MAEVNYRVTVSSLNEGSDTKYSPIDGIINSAIIQFPPGCAFKVEVYIFKRNSQILPSPVRGGAGGFINYGIALDSTTQSFEINENVKRGDPIEVRVINHDNTYDHTITAILLISETKSYTGP